MSRTLAAILSLVIATACCAATGLRAPPDLLERVGFDQNLGAQVPMNAVFRDARSKTVRLGDLLQGRPTLLVPGYFDCTNLCGIVRAGVAHGVAGSGLIPDQQFNVVLVSIDPHETPTDARTAQGNDALAHPDADVMHWHYLTGAQTSIAPLMRSIGFRYMYDSRNRQFDHAAGVVLLTPQGRVTQYLFGVQFPPRTLRLALVSASHGKIGNIVDRLLLLCCDYDPATGRYSVLINRVMLGLGIATALTLAGLILILKRGESRRHEQGGAA